MNAVVFGKNDYGGQIINDLSPFYALLYPFETIEQTHDWIIVKKKQFPNIHFVQLLQPIFPKEIIEPIIIADKDLTKRHLNSSR